ncbi:hypothetical protein PAAG_12081 [Paracoccidioides lutzii Pb01]|uniref:Xylulose kinase n=1 Tax=Paracoccidioides lutzii (strain ATCC MYA-826 / Pb01) TaxID=502779 RepID=A0A0A2V173_PARBA|nr:hypothetical protein PAAG_12081 [Paracoccidioides lutzii Pb01]KGQ01223.1 hypothetical protein PAAG_12081 [Paracoccidioides lutzii Pb01]
MPSEAQESGPLYIGFDLSTQQLKALVVTSDLRVVHIAIFDFDADSHGFPMKNGVQTNEAEHEVFAPVAMWLQALDGVLLQLKRQGLDFGRVCAISGAGQQHGSVYWNGKAERVLASLDAGEGLEGQVATALSHPFSPNWQDASTQRECDEFDEVLGGSGELAEVTGSKAHHRFTGPQILRFQRKYPDAYKKTSRISLVSSFLASLFLGKIAPIDISDKLGDVPDDGGIHLGKINRYFVDRYSFNPDCVIIPSTGDNPATILALPLRPGDAMNGGLAREQVRDAINEKLAKTTTINNNNNNIGTTPSNPWHNFDKAIHQLPTAGQRTESDPMKLALYFPKPEIVPNIPRGEWHFTYNPGTKTLTQSQDGWDRPLDDARAIVESQMLSLRLRSLALLYSPSPDLPAQPRSVYLVGGGSRNRAIPKVAGEVLGGVEGVYKLDVGENACALGAAYKAVWAMEKGEGQRFEELIEERWREGEFVERIARGYWGKVFGRFGRALEGFEMMEREVLREVGEGREVG